MSGRSALVRKKITEPKSTDRLGKSRSRAQSNSTSSDSATVREFPMGPVPGQHHDRNGETSSYYNANRAYRNRDSGSHSGSSVDGRRDGPRSPQAHAPVDDLVYVRRPPIRTDDVSGIEKSVLRSALDKKSSDVRNGLAKAFTFKRQDKRGRDAEAPVALRPLSVATVRPTRSGGVFPQDLPDRRGADSLSRHPEPPWDEAGGMMLPSPPNERPPVFDGASVMPIKRWVGAGRPVQRWNKLRKDPELWDPNGDVLVFFGQKDQSPWPNASFRLSSHIIEATESRYLITLLREGLVEEDMHTPCEQEPSGSGDFRGSGPPTPPGSEDNSVSDVDGQISYEMYFPTPPNMSKPDQLRHHITTRNVFALLYHSSLVGLSLHQALSDLHARLESYMPHESDNVGTIANYISSRGLDDVRDDAETAVGLLAFSEGSGVRWEEGWRESFLHCAGNYARLERWADFSRLSPITRALLERGHLEMQLRVQAAEERLAAFQYGDMWPAAVAVTANASGPVTAAPAKAAADRLERFLVQYYAREFGSWPPLPVPQDAGHRAVGVARGGDEGEGVWLTRTVAQLLQRDAAALYDYLVDRNVSWDESEARASRKWMMVAAGDAGFESDTPDLPMTDMLIEFDNKYRFPHIPHPYPLVPESIPPLGSRVAAEHRIQLAYTEATNLCALDSESLHSDLIDAFAKFEKTDHIGETDPATARRGRWVLVYGILQTLAGVAVDAPNVRYSDGVAYHLSPRLKGVRMPPWKSGRSSFRNPHEAAHELSHCWTVPETWNGDDRDDDDAAEHSA
ncbi:hypothetical protein BT67DRAFT_364740, partial [Trichocladium antarcticum]